MPLDIIPDGGTSVNFGAVDIPPIPPGFFNPGSEPFVGEVRLSGIDNDEGCQGGADTIVQRGGPLSTNGDPLPAPLEPVQVEIVELKLTSSQPITVTGDNGSEQWLVGMDRRSGWRRWCVMSVRSIRMSVRAIRHRA